MAIVETLDTITDWLNNEICPLVQFKKPNDMRHDEGYEYELVHPTAFSMFLPDSTDLLTGMTNAPSVTVMMTKGSDNFPHPKYQGGPGRSIDITLMFRTWDLGTHRDNTSTWVSPEHYEKSGESLERPVLDTNLEGWRDAWNFVDVVLERLETTREIDGLEIETDKGIQFSAFKDHVDLADMYPYWYAFVDFTVYEPLMLERYHGYALDDGDIAESYL